MMSANAQCGKRFDRTVGKTREKAGGGCKRAARAAGKSPRLVLLVDDHLILLDALKRQIAEDSDMQVTAAVGTISAAREVMEKSAPDVAVLDIQVGTESGLDVIPEFRRLAPSMRIVVMSMYDQLMYRDRAFELGADAYVTKGASYGELRSALLDRPGNGPNGEIQRVWFKRESGHGIRLTLSPRELNVVNMLANGMQIKEIADVLGVGSSTVGTYLRRAMEKAEVSTRTELLQIAKGLGVNKGDTAIIKGRS
jgi:DNA-binding NarL/FixJ family response regulator